MFPCPFTSRQKKIYQENKRDVERYWNIVLKSFSYKELRQEGPYKFSQDEITDLFSGSFRIDSIKETVYQGTLDPFPKALFIVMLNQ